MATRKFYAYYVEGNRLAIVQQESGTTSTDLRSEDYGKYKSPQVTVTNGLELLYTYVPNYRINNLADKEPGVTGYESSNGFLKFTGSGLSTDSTNIDYVAITGSDKWNGIHKVTTFHVSYWITDTKYNGAAVTETPGAVYTDVTKMEDESFELDLPDYLNNAVISYVKAKLAEDVLNIEAKEYFMREFKKYVEKHNSSKIKGHHRIMGFWGMR